MESIPTWNSFHMEDISSMLSQVMKYSNIVKVWGKTFAWIRILFESFPPLPQNTLKFPLRELALFFGNFIEFRCFQPLI